jgi:hypothetical protein
MARSFTAPGQGRVVNFIKRSIKKMKHYISMSGDRGYTPDHSHAHLTLDGAIETLLSVHTPQTDDIRYCPECLSSWSVDDLPKGGCPECKRRLLGTGTKKFARAIRKSLQNTWWFDRFPEGHGANYAEINSCTCDTPWIHSEDVDPGILDTWDTLKRQRVNKLITFDEFQAKLKELAQEFFDG